jgi:hypothetical protein
MGFWAGANGMSCTPPILFDSIEQIFALVTVVPSALSLIEAFSLHGVSRHYRKKKRRTPHCELPEF